MGSQTKKSSAIEAITNTLVAVVISILSYQFLGPLVGLQVTWMSNLYLTGYFTAMSFIRLYILRRIFNHANVRPEVPRVPTRVGSVQSLRRGGVMSGMPEHDYQDSTWGVEGKLKPRPDGPSPRFNESAPIKEDQIF